MDKLITSEEFIETELQKFEINETMLIALSDKYKNLKVADVNDREGLKEVRRARLELKETRVDITNKGKNLRASAVRFQKAVIAREEELIELIKPTEKLLEAEEDRIEAEKALIKLEEAKKEADRIQVMIDRMSAIGSAVDFHQLKALTDEQFEIMYAEGVVLWEESNRLKELEFEREKERIRQEEIARKEEAERMYKLAQEQEMENNRLKAIAEKQAREAEELQKERDALEAEKRAIAAARAAEDAEKKRLAELEIARQEAASKAVKAEQERIDREHRAKVEQERIEREEAAIEAEQRPDKEKIINFAQYLINDLEYPACSTIGGTKVIDAVKAKIQELATSMETSAKRKRW